MPEAHPRFALEQEVRFAVVMYGGVSLAIYINGVAQELFRLVKATAPADPYPPTAEAPAAERRVYFADEGKGAGGRRPALKGSEQVYRELGQQLGIAGPAPLRRDGDEPPPVRTRFVVDIVSGTSAGGINGVLLAKAIAKQQDFGVSERLWLKVADIAALLRGKDSWGDIPKRGRVEPESLLNGHRLFHEAVKALKEMKASEEELPKEDFRPAYAEQLELSVTATDLAGLPKPVRLGRDRKVVEKVHRKVFRFEYGIPQTLGEEHSDFLERHDKLLAFSARATSSFPFAFEPVKLDDVAFLTGDLDSEDDLEPWFEGYPDAGAVYFADGGYLDNKPFSYATQALRRRRADVPVSRKLLYIEPDPAPDDARPPAVRDRPDVYRNVMDAMGGLPRFEPIRQDIADVADRNAAIARVRAIERDAVRALERDLGATPPRTGPLRDAYLSLRARTLLDSLGARANRLLKLDEDEDRAIDVRRALSDWADGRDDREAQLERLDTAFLHRRASFLQDRANELLRGEGLAAKAAAVASLGGVGVPDATATALAPEQAAHLQAFKGAVNNAFDGVRRAGRAPYARNLGNTLSADQLKRFADVEQAALLLPDGVEGYVDAVAAFLREPLAGARDGIAAALAALAGESWTGVLLRAYDDSFELFDSIVLPLAYPDLGEANAVELWRVSPRESTGAVPARVEDPPQKLAGLRLHHFGAFLDESYRENDLLWGRLDGAEAILRAVLPDDEDEGLREHYRIALQAAILREAMPTRLRDRLEAELARPQDEDSDAALLDAFLARYTPPGDLGPGRREQLAGRALAITGRVLAKDARKHHLPKLPFAMLGRTGPAVVRLAGVRARLKRLNPLG